MPAYLCCPVRQCVHRIPDGTAAAEEMTDHLVNAHEFPETSASYQATTVLQPVHGAA